jgi:uncharacterized membrane protein YdfJ with MMPL/SSD domain
MQKWRNRVDRLERKLRWPVVCVWAAVAFAAGVLTKALFDYYT